MEIGNSIAWIASQLPKLTVIFSNKFRLLSIERPSSLAKCMTWLPTRISLWAQTTPSIMMRIPLNTIALLISSVQLPLGFNKIDWVAWPSSITSKYNKCSEETSTPSSGEQIQIFIEQTSTNTSKPWQASKHRVKVKFQMDQSKIILECKTTKACKRPVRTEILVVSLVRINWADFRTM